MYLYYFPLLAVLSFFLYPSLKGVYFLYTINFKKEKSVKKAIDKTARTILWVVYMMIYQKIAKNLVQLQKNEYDVHYIYHGQLFKIKCKHTSGPQSAQVLMITNDKLEDVTNEITPYMGPKYNFHNMNYTPTDFKERELSFYLSNGNITVFKDKEIISI